MRKLPFASDYMQGCDPEILKKLEETNLEASEGYGFDAYSEHARSLIRKACDCKDAEIWFLVGGTQVNMVMLDAMAESYEGIIAAETGHIAVHEAGAIERTGHKVMTIEGKNGKIDVSALKESLDVFKADENRDHMVQPGVVYLTQPTEYGTLYSRKELQEIADTAHAYGSRVYCDGARLAYALGSEQNDVGLQDLARYCDAFYIGGTKCGALFGEAVVIPKKDAFPHLFTQIKSHGALVAKGRITGIQFDVLFTENRYVENGRRADQYAEKIASAFREKGYDLLMPQATNQIFIVMENRKLEAFGEKVSYSYWEHVDADHTAIRLATSWGTTEEDVQTLIALL